jgi:hypothetical protein
MYMVAARLRTMVVMNGPAMMIRLMKPQLG